MNKLKFILPILLLISISMNAQIAGDVDLSGFIDGSEICGDVDNNFIIDGSEICGDVDGSFAINGSEICGDKDASFSIDAGESAGDKNGNSFGDAGEIIGDLSGNGIIEGVEVCGDRTGDGVCKYSLDFEKCGDVDGNGTIDIGEICGDISGDNSINYPSEVAGDISGNGIIDNLYDPESAGDKNGNSFGDAGEIIGDLSGNGIIDGSELCGDINGNGDITSDYPSEYAGDVSGNNTIDGSEVAGDLDASLAINGIEVLGDLNGNGIFESFECQSFITPSVSIVESPAGTTICSGTSVTFTATPTNGGTPSYQWYIGASPVVGETNATYTTSSLLNGDQVSVDMTSSEVCASPTNATSNAITMTVNSAVTPSVSVVVNPSTTICTGSSATFTATPTNGGTPSYQWYVLSSPVAGETNATFVSSTLNDQDDVYVEMTSTDPCASPTIVNSNATTMTVNTSIVPSVTVGVTPSTTICSGTSVTFTATPTNGGTPSYQWYIGASPVVGETNANFITTALNDQDDVYVEMTSTDPCAIPTIVNSNATTMTVNSIVSPSVSVGVTPSTTICSGSSVTFTATPTNGGTPSYQWYVLSSPIAGETNATFVSSTLNDQDDVYVEMTSSDPCAIPTIVNSSATTMTVNSAVAPSVSVGVNPSTTICTGSSATFTATPTNGGIPSYQWYVLSSPIVGETNATFVSSSLNDQDDVYVEMTSSDPCAIPTIVNSSATTMTVNTSIVPSVSVGVTPSTTICIGASATFTATPTNGGTPSYQWYVLSSPVAGETNATFVSSSLNDQDDVYVEMTSTDPCASPTIVNSSATTMTVNSSVSPSVSVGVTPGTTICSGSSVTFTATPTNGGTPSYQWYVFSSPIAGETNVTFVTSTLNDQEDVYVEMTSTDPCAIPTIVNSSATTITVNPTPLILSQPSGDNVNIGNAATFSVSGSNVDTYQWKKDGSNIVGATQSVYSIGTTVSGDAGTYTVLLSNACGSTLSTPAVLNIGGTCQTISVQPAIAGNICEGEQLSLMVNANAASGYLWKKDGIAIIGNASAQTNNLTIPKLTMADAGVYSVDVLGDCPTLNSDPVPLTVDMKPVFPQVVDEMFCKGFVATPLQGTADANHTLNWWGQDAVGGISSGTSPTPSTTNAGTYTYFVSQVDNATSCESDREVINVYVVEVNVPTSANVEYCYGASTNALTAQATSGFSLLWYGTDPTGVSSNVPPKPKSSNSGVTTYYVAQKHNTSSCESNKLAILVTVHQWPAIPTTKDTAICLFAKGVELPVDVLPNHSLVWWGKDEFGGTPTKVRLVPEASVIGETTYFVAQQDNNTGCISNRAPIVVSVIDNGCENEPIQLMGVGPEIANIGSSYTYEVYVNDPTYNVNNLSYEWSYTGTAIGWDSISPSVQNVYFYNDATEGDLYCIVYGFSEKPDTIKWEISLVENHFYNFLKPLKCPEVKANLVETYLDEVNFVNTNIYNANSGRASSGYADYTALFPDPPLYYWGEVMHIELVAKSSNSNKNYFGIFIDFNNNGSFGDEGDFVDYSDGLDVLTYTSSRVKLPDTSLAGNNSVCRVRVLVSPERAIDANDSCITNNFKGEVEDYLIRIEYNNKLSSSNLLTPNNDTKNDVFVVHGLVPGELNRLVVLNSTGQIVYEKEGYDNTWEGTDMNNLPLPAGNYFYVIVTDKNRIKGFVEIIRD